MFQAAKQVRAAGEAGWLRRAHLQGDAERASVTSINGIARWAVQSKGWNDADQTLYKRTIWSMKECRKWMNARSA